jgi:hypothetical protein
MAAKQGLSAQISQASEDAKRAVLNRANLTSSLWFSNLNTTCTIKSAPPRTPDVLNMLATKSGWLLKRNEQHVWQSRYCCVVPHTFLYYFDAASPGPNGTNGSNHGHNNNNSTGGPPIPPHQQTNLTPKQQDMLNKAVRQGYGKRGAAKSQQPRSSLYHVLGTAGGGGGTSATPAGPIPHAGGGDLDDDVYHHDGNGGGGVVAGTGTPHNNLQPAGIIDLECYTVVHRNSHNKMILELAGDDSVNPDLRSFYFCASSEDEGESWTQSFLSQRHSSLIDEKEAYQQVCDGFAQQLQLLHSELDNASTHMEQQQEELYRVRSSMEDMRRNCWRLVQDTLERTDSGGGAAKKAYRTDLETIQAQDLGLLAAVQLLCDYTRVLEETVSDCTEKTNKLEHQLEQAHEGDESRVKELEQEMEQLRQETSQQQAQLQSQLETLQQKYIQSQKECQDVQKDLASQRLEMTMYQSATRTKIGELQSHKKILKKEVIELRQKIEEVHSELDLVKHKQSSTKLEVVQERQKAQMLERYLEKMENQVKVQQNMMEMMSQAGSVAGDYYSQGGGPLSASPVVVRAGGGGGGGSRSYAGNTPTRGDYGTILMNTPSSVPVNNGEVDDDEEEDDEDDDDDEEVDQEMDPDCNIDRLNINLMGGGNHRPHPQHQHHHHHQHSNLPTPSPSSKRSGRRTIDDDNKSHMSELTEDRTQKQFDAAYFYHSSSGPVPVAVAAARPLISPRNGMLLPCNVGGPPAVIGVSAEKADELPTDTDQDNHNNNKGMSTPTTKQPQLDTIMVSHSSATLQRSTSTTRRNEIPRYNMEMSPPGGGSYSVGGGRQARHGSSGGGVGGNDPGSVSSYGSKPKLSVAQRSRLEADQHTTPVRIRMGGSNNSNYGTPIRGNHESPLRSSSARRGRQQQMLAPNSQSLTTSSSNNSVSSAGNFFASLGKKLESAIDNSIIGVVGGESSSDSESSPDGGGDVTDTHPKNVPGFHHERGGGRFLASPRNDSSSFRRGSLGRGNNEDDKNSANVIAQEEKKSSETASVSSAVCSFYFPGSIIGKKSDHLDPNTPFNTCLQLFSLVHTYRMLVFPCMNDRHFNEPNKCSFLRIKV